MMHKAIQAYLADLLPLCGKEGLQFSNEKEIAYGVQLEFADGKHTILLNVYHSAKKGLSTVISAKNNNPLKPRLESCLGIQSREEIIPQHNWQHWVGSDECGKGDFFGPLIVCGFYLDGKDKEKLLKLGVSDSKKLKKDRINTIAKQLYHDFAPNVECLVLKPKKYNELYTSFAGQGKNLNDLLAWCHSKILDNLIKRHSVIEGVFIDQFSHARKASALLKKLHPDMQIMERPDGERDLAVAAASIIARYQLLQSFQSMTRFYKLKFPMGASQSVITAGKAFIAQYGKDRLSEVAKLHFRTTGLLK
jgi:ribonuclease HIII